MQRSMNISPIRCTQSYAINIITLKLCFVFYKVQIIILNVALAIKGAILSVVSINTYNFRIKSGMCKCLFKMCTGLIRLRLRHHTINCLPLFNNTCPSSAVIKYRASRKPVCCSFTSFTTTLSLLTVADSLPSLTPTIRSHVTNPFVRRSS